VVRQQPNVPGERGRQQGFLAAVEFDGFKKPPPIGYTTRYATASTRRRKTSWQTLDTATADVIEEKGAETYMNVLANRIPMMVSICLIKPI
jgi:hypothetical protein